jgi:putative membrane protein
VKKLLLLSTLALPLTLGAALAQTQLQREQAAQGQTGSGPGITHSPATPVQGSQRAASPGEANTAAGFAHTAAVSDMYEIESSQLVEQRSSNQAVKGFAQQMINDHQKTTQQLQGLMQQMSGGAQTRTTMDAKHTEMLNQLRNARGSDFDRIYLLQQVQAHTDAVNLFRNYAQSGDNAQLKQWASATLPALQQHLQMAQQLQQQHGRS